MRTRLLTAVLAVSLGLGVSGQALAQIRWPVLPFTTPPKGAQPAPKAGQPAAKTARGRAQPIAAPAAGPASWRAVDPENTLVIDTNKGRIIVELAPTLAPLHVQQIKILARRGFYNNRSFFRVIDEFMAQTGDPQDNGTGQSDLPNLQPEFTFQRGRDAGFAQISPGNSPQPVGFIGATPVRTQPDAMMALMATGKVSAQGIFCPGVAGMARGEELASGNSQFFLMRSTTVELNGSYTVFGRVVAGLDVVRSIKTGEPVPQPQDKMTTVRVLADIPAGERPDVQVLRTDSPAFQAQAAAQIAADPNFDICDLEIPSLVR